MEFKEIQVNELKNPVYMISRQWMLVTAGTKEQYNTLTASWGGIGYIWNKNAVTIYIRSSRFTKKFVDENDTFSLSFLPENNREILNFCGTVSGREVDKINKSGLHVVFEEATPYFEEAEIVLLCKKMYVSDMKSENLRINAEVFYPEGDYHCIYIAEIQKILKNKSVL